MSDYRIPSWMVGRRTPEAIERYRKHFPGETPAWMTDPEEEIVAHIVRVEKAAREAKVILDWTVVPYRCTNEELQRIIDAKKAYRYRVGDYLPHYADTLLTATSIGEIGSSETTELRGLHGYYYWTFNDMVLGMRQDGSLVASPYVEDIIVTRFGTYEEALMANVRVEDILERREGIDFSSKF